MENTKIHRGFITPRGIRLQVHYRPSQNDFNTLCACISDDEYCLNDIITDCNGVGIDLGSHVGGASLAMASMGMTVYAVEALPENCEIIRANIRLNNMSDRVRLYHRAIGANDSSLLFAHYGNKETANGRLHRCIGYVLDAPREQPGVDIIRIKTVSLDTIFKENKIDRCHLIKVDAEGGEWSCFQNASPETLSKIDNIVIEVHSLSTPFVDELGHHRGKPEDFYNMLSDYFINITSQYPKFDTKTHLVLRGK